MTMNLHDHITRAAAALFVCATFTAPGLAQDLVISQIGDDVWGSAGNGLDFDYYGEFGGIAAFSFATTSCNVGDMEIDWYKSPDTRHPMIGQSIYRVKDGRIEQVGQSWLKHGFCAADMDGTCGPCAPSAANCDLLGIGCSDTYTAWHNGHNDEGHQSPKFLIDPTTGVLTLSPSDSTPTGDDKIRGRLQVKVEDIDPALNGGAVFIAEAQYTSEQDHLAGNSRNNVSMRILSVPSLDNITGLYSTIIGEPAIYLWRYIHNDVLLNEVVNANEGGLGVDGHIFVASRATQLPNGKYRYEYAIQNLDSAQAIGSFGLPATCANVQLEDFDQHHVDFHSGELWGSEDWGGSYQDGMIQWATTPFAVDPNASAIRWGTMANFAFTSNMPPREAEAQLGMFAPGVSTSLTTTVLSPCDDLRCTFERYCERTPNSVGDGGVIYAFGSASIVDNDLQLAARALPPGQFGIFFYGPEELQHPFGGGLLCVGASLNRIWPPVQANSLGLVELDLDLWSAPFNSQPGMIEPGSSWNFQLWYRDPAGPTFSGYNFTDAMRIHFCR